MTQIAVTGAGGFIGGRLAEVLACQPGTWVNVLLRRGSNPARVARFGNVRLFFGDIGDPAFVEKALQGCTQVFHCAYGTRGTEEELRRVTVGGSLNVFRAARACGLARMVHLSSVAIWGYALTETIAESTPSAPDLRGYCAHKKEAEEQLVQVARRAKSVAVSIILPTLVYGPYSPYLLDAVRRMREGMFGLPPGTGLINHIYIDDLVLGILLAAKHPGQDVERYIITDPEPMSCKEFFDPLVTAVGATPLPVAHPREGAATRRLSLGVVMHSLFRNQELRQWLRNVPGLKGTYRVARRMGQRIRPPEPLGNSESAQTVAKGPTLSPGEWDFYSSTVRFSGAKATQELGFTPVVGYREGMRRSVLWLTQLGLV